VPSRRALGRGTASWYRLVHLFSDTLPMSRPGASPSRRDDRTPSDSMGLFGALDARSIPAASTQHRAARGAEQPGFRSLALHSALEGCDRHRVLGDPRRSRHLGAGRPGNGATSFPFPGT